MTAQQELRIHTPSPIERRKSVIRRDLSEYRAGVETDPGLLGRVQMLVALTYRNRFAPERNFYTVLSEISRDEYSQEGRSLPIVMKRPDTGTKDSPGDLEDFVGHMRLVLGNRSVEPGANPIEAWDLMSPSLGWEIYLLQSNLREHEIGELGRLAFAEDVSRSQNVKIAKALIEESFVAAREQGIKRLFAIMPPGIAALFARGKNEPTLIHDAKLRNTKKVHRLQRDYPGYWDKNDIKKQPKLYYWDVPERGQ